MLLILHDFCCQHVIRLHKEFKSIKAMFVVFRKAFVIPAELICVFYAFQRINGINVGFFSFLIKRFFIQFSCISRPPIQVVMITVKYSLSNCFGTKFT